MNERIHSPTVDYSDLTRNHFELNHLGEIEKQIDFAIITTLDVERLAVCKALGLTDKHRYPKEARWYWQGRFPLRDETFYEVAVAQLSDTGNINAAVATAHLIRHWMPHAILLVGIAAAATPEQNLGDGVFASQVHYYERQKVTPKGTKPECKIYPADAVLWNCVTTLPKWKGSIRESRPDGKRTKPKVHKGVIACGEKVIAAAIARDRIASLDRKIVAIEMEGYGVGTAAWESFEQVRFLVIKAISDLADSEKNDAWHEYSAAVAASLMRHLLFACPLQPRTVSKPVKQLSPECKEGPNGKLSSQMVRYIENARLTGRIKEETKRVLSWEHYPRMMSLAGTLVENPIWTQIPNREQIELTNARRPNKAPCPGLLVLDLFLIKAEDVLGNPFLLTVADDRTISGWKAFLFPFRRRIEKETTQQRFVKNVRELAGYFRVPTTTISASSLGSQFLVSVKPHPGYSVLYVYVFEFCAVELRAPPKWLSDISPRLPLNGHTRRFQWFTPEALEDQNREMLVNGDVICALYRFFSTNLPEIPTSVRPGFLHRA